MASCLGLKVLVSFFAFSMAMAETPEFSSPTLRKLAVANNGFALNLYQQIIRERTENVFISPLSIMSVLTMLLHGARGETRKELSKVLGYEKEGLADESIHGAFKQLLAQVYTKNTSSGYTLNSAGRILVDKSIDLLPNYNDEVEMIYSTSVTSVDFENEASEIKKEINDWVQEKTHGKVKDFLDEVDPKWVMVLLNAVHFKGVWEIPFNPFDTSPMPFHNYDKDTEPKKVDTMTILNRYYYSEEDDYQALRIPYKNNNTDMLIVLPKEIDGLPELVEHLTSEKLNKIVSDLREVEVNVHLPKFKFETMTNLKSHLNDLGWKSVSGGNLDLSGMTKTEQKVAIDKVFQKAFIEVNEVLTEAAAVSVSTAGAIMLPPSPPSHKEFFADRPFMFVVMNRKSNLILFMGQVAEL